MIVQVYKKGNKQFVENFRLAPLLPTMGKIFDRILFSLLHEFLEENSLLC